MVWFNCKAGYGFIRCWETGRDVFVHCRAIVEPNPDHSQRSLGEGKAVAFRVVDTAKGPEAVDVTEPGGAAV